MFEVVVNKVSRRSIRYTLVARALAPPPASEYKSPVMFEPPFENMALTPLGAPSLKKTIIRRLERFATGIPFISLKPKRRPSADAVLPPTLNAFIAFTTWVRLNPRAPVFTMGTSMTPPDAKDTSPTLSPLVPSLNRLTKSIAALFNVGNVVDELVGGPNDPDVSMTKTISRSRLIVCPVADTGISVKPKIDIKVNGIFAEPATSTCQYPSGLWTTLTVGLIGVAPR